MALSRDAHFALVVLVCALGAIAFAKHEARTSAKAATSTASIVASPKPTSAHPSRKREAPTGQGAMLRDHGRLDPSRASASELELLPGVGPSLARRIVESREREGAFRRPEDLLRVKGVGVKTLAKLAPFLSFGADSRSPFSP